MVEIICYYRKLSLTVTEVEFKNHLNREDFPAASAICCLVTGTPSDTKNTCGVERNKINAHPVTTSKYIIVKGSEKLLKDTENRQRIHRKYGKRISIS